MFEKRNLVTERERIRGHDGEEYDASAQDIAQSMANYVEALIAKAVERAIGQTNVGICALHTQLSEVINQQQAILEQLDDKLAPLRTKTSKIEAGQQQIGYSLERISERIEQLRAESQLLENASQEKQLLTHEYYENHIFLPMVRSLIPIFDFVEDARNGTPSSGNAEERIQKITEGVSIQLVQFLSVHGVEPIQHKIGARFDPSEMRPVKTETTHDKRLDNRVAKSLRTGFRGQQQRLLRPESVALYKYRESKSITSEKERSKS